MEGHAIELTENPVHLRPGADPGALPGRVPVAGPGGSGAWGLGDAFEVVSAEVEPWGHRGGRGGRDEESALVGGLLDQGERQPSRKVALI